MYLVFPIPNLELLASNVVGESYVKKDFIIVLLKNVNNIFIDSVLEQLK